MEKIEFIIDKHGDFVMEVNGVKGGKCKDITKALQNLGTITESKNTAEAFEIPVPDFLEQRLSE